jgi:predicted O-linked N-acetylglucosamine transferase (SPINDLY family)
VCPQTPQKFHPDFDPVLRRILNAEPTAHLVLTAGWDGAAMEVVRLRLVAPDPALAARIHVLGPLPRESFIGLLRRADVLLDPPHYSGGHTTLEAFACGGAPVVTWPGRHMRARHTYGFYRLMGILDAVAADLDAYGDITLGLLRDAARRDVLRHRIAATSHRLFEDQSVVDAFEAFLWVAAHAPEQWAAHPAGEQTFGIDCQRHDDG